MSGFTISYFLVYPLPEKSDIEFVNELYPPTVITFLAVDGRVRVVFIDGFKK